MQIRNHIYDADISVYSCTNDAIGRRTAIARSGTMMSETRTDYYGYNDRNELVSAAKSGGAQSSATEYEYSYDDIGNRLLSFDLGTNRTYTANRLNQYTSISNRCLSASLRDEFIPRFDDDGNQTLIKTATGVWQVSYNAENRPVLWECGSTNITMKFDRMGRRVEYIETVNSVTNTHHHFVYDGYLCIQRLNAASNNAIDLVFGWDPSEPVATRPLILQKYGQYNLFYTHDGNKNVSELVFFQQANGIAAHYEYAPFGAVTATGRSTPVTAYDFCECNSYRFSSEYADDALGLVYYNYRHYNTTDGRWTNRDTLAELGQWVASRYDVRMVGHSMIYRRHIDEYRIANDYISCHNGNVNSFDILGKYDDLEKLIRKAPWNDLHGRYCGAKRVNGELLPNGQEGMSPQEIGSEPPIDKFDECCLEHDRCLASADVDTSLSPSNRNLAIHTCDFAIAGCWLKAQLTDKNASCWTRVKCLGATAIMPFAHPQNPFPMEQCDGSVAIGLFGFTF